VRVFHQNVGTHVDIPLKLSDGKFSVTLGAHEKGQDAALGFNQGVTFITEFEAFEKTVQLKGSGRLPVPFTYCRNICNRLIRQGGRVRTASTMTASPTTT
jgi:hypothetical protein